MTAPLSAKDRFAYGEWVVKPSYEQAIGTVNKPLHIPIPGRWAKWYEMGWYRALIADAEAKFGDVEHAVLDFRRTGAGLPETAARVGESPAGDDDSFRRMGEQAEAHETERAYEDAFERANHEGRRDARHERHEHLFQQARASVRGGHPIIETEGPQLDEAGVEHFRIDREPMPDVGRPRHAPVQFPLAGGYPAVREFPDYYSLNQPHARLTPAQNRVFYEVNNPAAEPLSAAH